MSNLTRLWNGELPLDAAYWNWAVLGGLAINIASSTLFLLLVIEEWVITALIVGYVFSVPYNVVVAVGVWRSADRYAGEPLWAALAKITTIFGMGLLTVT